MPAVPRLLDAIDNLFTRGSRVGASSTPPPPAGLSRSLLITRRKPALRTLRQKGNTEVEFKMAVNPLGGFSCVFSEGEYDFLLIVLFAFLARGNSYFSLNHFHIFFSFYSCLFFTSSIPFSSTQFLLSVIPLVASQFIPFPSDKNGCPSHRP